MAPAPPRRGRRDLDVQPAGAGGHRVGRLAAPGQRVRAPGRRSGRGRARTQPCGSATTSSRPAPPAGRRTAVRAWSPDDVDGLQQPRPAGVSQPGPGRRHRRAGARPRPGQHPPQHQVAAGHPAGSARRSSPAAAGGPGRAGPRARRTRCRGRPAGCGRGWRPRRTRAVTVACTAACSAGSAPWPVPAAAARPGRARGRRRGSAPGCRCRTRTSMRAASGPVAWSATTAGTASRWGRRAVGRPCHAATAAEVSTPSTATATRATVSSRGRSSRTAGGGRARPGRAAPRTSRLSAQTSRPVPAHAVTGDPPGRRRVGGEARGAGRAGRGRGRSAPARPARSSPRTPGPRRSIATRPASSTGTDSSSDHDAGPSGCSRASCQGAAGVPPRTARPGPVSRSRQSSRDGGQPGPEQGEGHDERGPAARTRSAPGPRTSSTSARQHGQHQQRAGRTRRGRRPRGRWPRCRTCRTRRVAARRQTGEDQRQQQVGHDGTETSGADGGRQRRQGAPRQGGPRPGPAGRGDRPATDVGAWPRTAAWRPAAARRPRRRRARRRGRRTGAWPTSHASPASTAR